MISFILAGIMFLITIVLFFRLNISKVFGDITGKTARKAIKNINDQNARSTGDKSYKSRPQSIKKEKPNDKASSLESPVVQKSQENTTVLYNNDNVTTVLYNDSCANTNSDITGPLEGLNYTNTKDEDYNQQFQLELDITYIHTNEIIL